MNHSEDFQEGVNNRIFHNNNYLSNVVNAFLYSFDCAPYSFLIFFSSSTLCLPPEFDKRRNTLLVLPVSGVLVIQCWSFCFLLLQSVPL